MFTKLTDTTKAAIFSVLLLLLGVGAALLINMLGLTTGFGMFTLWMTTPAVATLIMLLVVTRDGYSSEAWKSLGLPRVGHPARLLRRARVRHRLSYPRLFLRARRFHAHFYPCRRGRDSRLPASQALGLGHEA